MRLPLRRELTLARAAQKRDREPSTASRRRRSRPTRHRDADALGSREPGAQRRRLRHQQCDALVRPPGDRRGARPDARRHAGRRRHGCIVHAHATSRRSTTDTIDLTACFNTPAEAQRRDNQIPGEPHADRHRAERHRERRRCAHRRDRHSTLRNRSIELTSFAPSLPAIGDARSRASPCEVAHSESAGTTPALVDHARPAAARVRRSRCPSAPTLATDTVTVPSSCITTGNTAERREARVPGHRERRHDRGVRRCGDHGVVSRRGRCSRARATRPSRVCSSSSAATATSTSRTRAVELCAGPSPGNPGETGYTAQQIAVYGVPPTPTMVPSTAVGSPTGHRVVGERHQRGDVPHRRLRVATQASSPRTSHRAATVRSRSRWAASTRRRSRRDGGRQGHGAGQPRRGSLPDRRPDGRVHERARPELWHQRRCTAMTWFNPHTWIGPAYDESNVTPCFDTAQKLAGASVDASP